MIQFKYLGTDSRTLANVGLLNPGDTFEVTERMAFQIEANSPETFERVPEVIVPETIVPPAAVEVPAAPVEVPAVAVVAEVAAVVPTV